MQQFGVASISDQLTARLGNVTATIDDAISTVNNVIGEENAENIMSLLQNGLNQLSENN